MKRCAAWLAGLTLGVLGISLIDLFRPIPVLAQPVPAPVVRYVTTLPTGGCGYSYIALKKTDGTMVGCVNAIWASIGGGGGGTANQNLRPVQFTFDGGSTAITGSPQTAKHVPFSGTLSQLVTTCEDATGAPLSGTATVDLLSVSRATWIASGTAPSTIHSTGSACTFTTTFGSNCSLTNWATTIAADTMLAANVTSVTNCVRIAVDAVITAN